MLITRLSQLFVLISQSRNNISAMYTSQQPTGGQATKFYSSTVIKLFSSESDNQAIKGKINVGDNLLKKRLEEKFVGSYNSLKHLLAFKMESMTFILEAITLALMLWVILLIPQR
jgi:hypothetical protein